MKSNVSGGCCVLGSTDKSIELRSVKGSICPLFRSTSIGDAWSINALDFKESAKKPLLNLSNPSASLTCKVATFCSNNDNDVTFSRFSSLSSIAPISRIV